MSNAAIAVSTALWRMTFSASAELSRKELKHAVAQLEAAEKHLDSMAEKVLREARIGHPFALDLEKRVCLDRNGTYVPVRMHSNSQPFASTDPGYRAERATQQLWQIKAR